MTSRAHIRNFKFPFLELPLTAMSFRVASRTLQRARHLSIRPACSLTQPRCNYRSIIATQARAIHASAMRSDRSFTNMLADDNPPAVQVNSITEEGIQLADGLLLPSACIFLEGKVFLWDVPKELWGGWGKEHFEIFETVVPKPGEPLLVPKTLQTLHDRYTRNLAAWNWQKNIPSTSSIANISEPARNSG